MDGGDSAVAGTAALHLASLIASRLCHDLSGPLSGMGAALGEVAEDPTALALASDAAAVLRGRLSLLRTAWGGLTPALDRAGLHDLAGGLPNAAKLRLEFDALAPTPAFAPPAGRLMANVLLLAAESLPFGGMLALAGSPAGQIVVTIAGHRAAWPSGLGAMLASVAEAWRAIVALEPPAGLRGLPAPLTALLAHESGVRAALLLAGQAETVPPLLLDFNGVPAV